jgi:hypothetical protein
MRLLCLTAAALPLLSAAACSRTDPVAPSATVTTVAAPVTTVAAEPPPAADVQAKARALVAALDVGEFRSAARDFDDGMKKALPGDRLEMIWKDLLKKVGPFREVRGVRGEKIQTFDAVFVTCHFDKTDLDVKIVFTPEKQVTGLFFVPSKPAVPAKTPPYARPDACTESAATVESGEYRLPGTLTVPNGAGPFPAVVLLHGSGPQDRDETIGPNKPLRDLAWGLAGKGVAVLRFDKRTQVYGPKLVKEKITLKEEVVDDAVAAAALLRKQPKVDPKKVFVLGHSLGAVAAPQVGERDPDLAGLVVMAANTRPPTALAGRGCRSPGRG